MTEPECRWCFLAATFKLVTLNPMSSHLEIRFSCRDHVNFYQSNFPDAMTQLTEVTPHAH